MGCTDFAAPLNANQLEHAVRGEQVLAWTMQRKTNNTVLVSVVPLTTYDGHTNTHTDTRNHLPLR